MPDKEPVQPDVDILKEAGVEDADSATTESILKELGIEGEDAQTPGAQRCAEILAAARTDLAKLTNMNADLRRRNIANRVGEGKRFGVFETVDEV